MLVNIITAHFILTSIILYIKLIYKFLLLELTISYALLPLFMMNSTKDLER